MPRIIHTRRAVLAAGVAVLCAVAAVAAGVASSAPRYAKTVTSTGAIDPAAIPLGDGYLGTSPKVGYVDSCQTTFRGGGAQHAGPWIDTAAKTWDMATKLAVNGKVSWPAASYSVKVANGKRVFTFDDLPTDHTTGVFPIASSDPAYQYDRNPNHIAKQTVSWTLDATPSAARKPSCVGLGPIGVLSDGVYLYNALDAAGNDAGAHEVQDACGGHPDGSSSYHHHDVPACIYSKAPNGKATLVGYALDGYGIYVVKDASGAMPTNTDLDACHGTTSVVDWNGKATKIYHYVATLEYPYTVGYYHGTPIRKARVVGGGAGAGQRRGNGPGAGGAPGVPPRRPPGR
jgi:YHYH protein